MPRGPETPERGETVWALVVEPGGAANLYHWDERQQALALTHVERPTMSRGADLARIPLARWDGASQPLDTSAPGLLALVLADPPNAPGVWLRIRLLGALVLGAQQSAQPDALAQLRHSIAIAMPAADPALADIGAWDDLPSALRQRVERAAQTLRGAGEPLVIGPGSPRWLDAPATMALYRAARASLALGAAARRAASAAEAHERLTTSGEALAEAFAQRMRRDAPGSHRDISSVGHAPAHAGGVLNSRGLSGVSMAEWRVRGAAVLGEAEDLLTAVPQRFMRYLGELLAPDERALFFLESPPFPLRAHDEDLALIADSDQRAMERSHWLLGPLTRLTGPKRIQTRQTQTGLLLITDRQLMLLRDFAPPNAGATQQGYIVTCWPLGRLVAVGVVPPGQRLARTIAEWPQRIQARQSRLAPGDEVGALAGDTARLALALEGCDGIQVTGCALPADAQPALARAAATLRSFIPLLGAAGAGDWRLRPLPDIRPWRPTEAEARELTSLGGVLTPTAVAALETATAKGLSSATDALILAQARSPAMSVSGPETAALLTLTPKHVLLATLPVASPREQATAQASLRALPLGCLTSVTLQYSLVGSWLRLTHPTVRGELGCEMIHIAFPSPLITPFRALRNRIGSLLATGPTLGVSEAAGERPPTPRAPASR